MLISESSSTASLITLIPRFPARITAHPKVLKWMKDQSTLDDVTLQQQWHAGKPPPAAVAKNTPLERPQGNTRHAAHPPLPDKDEEELWAQVDEWPIGDDIAEEEALWAQLEEIKVANQDIDEAKAAERAVSRAESEEVYWASVEDIGALLDGQFIDIP